MMTALTISKPCVVFCALFQVSHFNRKELLDKLFMVIGIDAENLRRHPDKSYVLTADNTKKMLAILMRFRYYIIIPLC